tara:strand:+ start:481 stop:663 length:183 start_codon:yes stop_codon:yes gene_type:complete
MDKSDLQKLIEVRSRAIRLFDKLDGKNEPTATVLQSDVAHETEGIIRMIDKILQGKVAFQ